MDDSNSQNLSLSNNVLKSLFVASNSSTLTEALECLIEIAKTSNGRSDLSSKHILVPVLELCQSPNRLSAKDLLLSIKLLRNMCAGEIKNQNLFVEQNGVGLLSSIITSIGLTCGTDNSLLRMGLQVLGNVSLGGKEHRLVVWRQLFPLGFLDIARVQSKETCDPLCMVIYTCCDGSSEQFAELLSDNGLDIVIEIIRTVAVAGFKEDWVKLLLSRICLEESHFSSVFSKQSPLVLAENSDETRISHFGADQAFLLSILSEILNERAGDFVVSYDVSSCILRILRNAVAIVNFSKKGKSTLPTGSADIDVLGYTLCFLRDIIAFDAPELSKKDNKRDSIDMLVSDGLIKLLVNLLRDLEPPEIIKKAMVHNEVNNGTTSNTSKYCPYRGFRRDVIAIIGNCGYRRKNVKDEIREENGILLLLQHCATDDDNPFLREWGIWSLRNILEGNMENQELVANLELQQSVDVPEITGMGLRVEVDPQTRRAKLVNIS